MNPVCGGHRNWSANHGAVSPFGLVRSLNGMNGWNYWYPAGVSSVWSDLPSRPWNWKNGRYKKSRTRSDRRFGTIFSRCQNTVSRNGES